MEYRRDISQLADTFQACTAEIFSTFVHQTCSCCCLCRASGSNDDNVVRDQLLHQLDVSGVRTDFRVVASYHGNCTADNAGCHTLPQRHQSSGLVNLGIGYFIQSLDDGLKRVSNGCFLLHMRDMYQLRFPVFKVFNCHFYDGFCILTCCFCVETNVFCIRHLRNRAGGNEFSMETFA